MLEIGSGGCNAALLAELVGPGGQVTTMDIDPEVTGRAAMLLRRHGYGAVRVVTGDAARGRPERAPFDAIVVTAGAWDIPPAWREQLVEGGRLVLPLRMRGLTRSIAFARRGEVLASVSARLCGFVPMQGREEHRARVVPVAGAPEITLAFDDACPAAPDALDAAVAGVRREAFSGVTVGVQEPMDSLQLWLATRLDGFCTMAVDTDRDSGLVAPAHPSFSLAAVSGRSFGYLVWRRLETTRDRRVELGAHALGPEAVDLAGEICEQVRVWDQTQRGGDGPVFTAHPATAVRTARRGERVIDKRHTRITISWPEV